MQEVVLEIQMARTLAAMLDDGNNEANYDYFVDGHPTWRCWHQLQTIYLEYIVSQVLRFNNLRQLTEQDLYDIIYSVIELIALFRVAG